MVLGQRRQMGCFISHIQHDNVTFTWTIHNQEFQQHTQKLHKYENNTAKSVSSLTFNVTEKDEHLNLTCSVTSSTLPNATVFAFLEVYCKKYRAKTSNLKAWLYTSLFSICISHQHVMNCNVFISHNKLSFIV